MVECNNAFVGGGKRLAIITVYRIMGVSAKSENSHEAQHERKRGKVKRAKFKKY